MKILTFWSAGGGVGKTTLAAAWALALKEKGRVVLADLKEVTPHVHRYFGIELQNMNDIYDAVETGTGGDIGAAVKKHLQKRRGIWILPGFGLNDFHKFDEKHFSAVLGFLAEEFDNVVVDTASGIFFASTYAALKCADEVRVVLTPGRWMLEDSAAMIDFVCSRWGIERSRMMAVLNMVGSRGDLDVDTVRRVLGMEVCSISHGHGQQIEKQVKGVVNSAN